MAAGVALAFAALSLAPALGALVLDDNVDITKHPLMLDGLIAALGKSPFRFVTYLTYWINLNLPGSEAAWLHVGNIALHLVASIMLYAMVTAFVEGARGRVAGAVAASFFALDPLMCSTVLYVSARPAMLVMIGTAAAAWGMKRYVDENRVEYIAAALGGAMLALFSKESGVAVAGVAFAFAIIFGAGGKWKYAAIPVWALCLVYVAARFTHKIDLGDSGAGTVGAANYLLTQLKVAPMYALKYFFPLDLSLQWDVPVNRSIASLSTVASLIGIVGLFAGAVFVFRSDRAALLFVAWIPMSLAVESSFIPLKDLAFDHRFYCAGAGVAALIGITIANLAERTTRKDALMVAGVVVALCFAAIDLNRSMMWRDSVGPWREAVEVAPDTFRARYNLGHTLLESGKLTPALPQLNTAIRIGGAIPAETAIAYNARGLVRMKQKRYDDAAADFTKAIELEKYYGDAVYHLGIAKMMMGDLDSALKWFEEARRLFPVGDPQLEAATRKARELLEIKRRQGGEVAPR